MPREPHNWISGLVERLLWALVQIWTFLFGYLQLQYRMRARLTEAVRVQLHTAITSDDAVLLEDLLSNYNVLLDTTVNEAGDTTLICALRNQNSISIKLLLKHLNFGALLPEHQRIVIKTALLNADRETGVDNLRVLVECASAGIVVESLALLPSHTYTCNHGDMQEDAMIKSTMNTTVEFGPDKTLWLQSVNALSQVGLTSDLKHLLLKYTVEWCRRYQFWLYYFPCCDCRAEFRAEYVPFAATLLESLFKVGANPSILYYKNPLDTDYDYSWMRWQHPYVPKIPILTFIPLLQATNDVAIHTAVRKGVVRTTMITRMLSALNNSSRVHRHKNFISEYLELTKSVWHMLFLTGQNVKEQLRDLKKVDRTTHRFYLSLEGKPPSLRLCATRRIRELLSGAPNIHVGLAQLPWLPVVLKDFILLKGLEL